jgi:argininosuccinate synthase
MAKKVVLAYSGGLDTSVAIRWLQEERGYDVVAHYRPRREKDLQTVEQRSADRAQYVATASNRLDYFAFPR